MTRSCYQEEELKKKRTEKRRTRRRECHGNDFMKEWTPVTEGVYIPSCIGRVHLNGILGINEIVDIEKIEDIGYKLLLEFGCLGKKYMGQS